MSNALFFVTELETWEVRSGLKKAITYIDFQSSKSY